MAIVKYNAVHVSPKAHLKYILNPDKNEQMKYVTGICCNDDLENAHADFKQLFEMYDSEKFDVYKKGAGKNHIRLHTYIQSFESNVSAELAHEIGVKWAKAMFGENRPVIITTHTNTKHAHNHIAVCPYDIYGKKWHANKATLRLARETSDKICKEYHLEIIENPKRYGTIPYAEWLARNNGTSWKVKMADDIDRIILDPSVKNMETFIEKMKSEGYIFTNEKKLICKPQNVKNGCSLYRLGIGYKYDNLRIRIGQKYKEFAGADLTGLSGNELCIKSFLRDFQRVYYRQPLADKDIYKELQDNAQLLTYISNHNIHSEKELEKLVNQISADHYHKSMEANKYRFAHPDDYEHIMLLEKQAEEIEHRKYEAAKIYRDYLRLKEQASAYDYLKNTQNMSAGDKNIIGQINFTVKLRNIVAWADKVKARAAEIKERQERENRNSYYSR